MTILKYKLDKRYMRINPDTGKTFEFMDQRPKLAAADGREYIQDGKLFASFCAPRINNDGFYLENWRPPKTLDCQICNEEFITINRGVKNCDKHRKVSMKKTKGDIKQWIKSGMKPCERSDSVGWATGCDGGMLSLDNFKEHKDRDYKYFNSLCNKCNAETKWRTIIKKKYGITYKDYYRQEEIQQNRCKICGSKEKGKARTGESRGKWIIDHDHITGSARGLLCFRCNTLLGNANDDPKILNSAITYLDRSKIHLRSTS